MSDGKLKKKELLKLLLFLVVPIFSTAQSNWLYFSNAGNICPSYLQIGDVDVSGDQITVEATINKIADGIICTNGFQAQDGYDVVSKSASEVFYC